MVRATTANFRGEPFLAEEVDDDYLRFIHNGNNHRFTCVFCNAKVCFSRGIDEKDPHFRNWPNTEHSPNCRHEILYNTKGLTGSVEVIKSTILPRAARLKAVTSNETRRVIKRRFFGRDSKRFIAAVSQLIKERNVIQSILVEDGTETTIDKLLMRQDAICERLEQDSASYICILRGYTSKVIRLPTGSIKVTLTQNSDPKTTKYGNTKPFYLFIPKSMVEKNERHLKAMEKRQVLCYGVAQDEGHGPKMDLLSINHQIHLF